MSSAGWFWPSPFCLYTWLPPWPSGPKGKENTVHAVSVYISKHRNGKKFQIASYAHIHTFLVGRTWLGFSSLTNFLKTWSYTMLNGWVSAITISTNSLSILFFSPEKNKTKNTVFTKHIAKMLINIYNTTIITI